MSRQSFRVDDAVLMITGKPHFLEEGEDTRMVTVSLPGFIFKDGEGRKRNLEVGSAGQAHLDRLVRDIRKAAAPLVDYLLENKPEDKPEPEPDPEPEQEPQETVSSPQDTEGAENQQAPAPEPEPAPQPAPSFGSFGY